MATFIHAAERVGLGCCPISVIRDHAATVSALLDLPPRVFPIAGLCVGWPLEPGDIIPRLSLTCTLHTDQYNEGNLAGHFDEFDHRRARAHPLPPRDADIWGHTDPYGWSEDKARQFAAPQCADFGSFIVERGFNPHFPSKALISLS